MVVVNIKVEYDGKFPNLCSGTLKVTIEGKKWNFGVYNLSSGGNVWFDDEWGEHVELGPWSIDKWPEGFPEELKECVTEAVNERIPEGCCGGCV